MYPICPDINECAGTNNCDENAVCTNTPGNYICDCKAGYTGNGYNCEGKISRSLLRSVKNSNVNFTN